MKHVIVKIFELQTQEIFFRTSTDLLFIANGQSARSQAKQVRKKTNLAIKENCGN